VVHNRTSVENEERKKDSTSCDDFKYRAKTLVRIYTVRSRSEAGAGLHYEQRSCQQSLFYLKNLLDAALDASTYLTS